MVEMMVWEIRVPEILLGCRLCGRGRCFRLHRNHQRCGHGHIDSPLVVVLEILRAANPHEQVQQQQSG